jgi:hypothetical protein
MIPLGWSKTSGGYYKFATNIYYEGERNDELNTKICFEEFAVQPLAKCSKVSSTARLTLTILNTATAIGITTTETVVSTDGMSILICS